MNKKEKISPELGVCTSLHGKLSVSEGTVTQMVIEHLCLLIHSLIKLHIY
jgi:hypothetical protein